MITLFCIYTPAALSPKPTEQVTPDIWLGLPFLVTTLLSGEPKVFRTTVPLIHCSRFSSIGSIGL